MLVQFFTISFYATIPKTETRKTLQKYIPQVYEGRRILKLIMGESHYLHGRPGVIILKSVSCGAPACGVQFHLARSEDSLLVPTFRICLEGKHNVLGGGVGASVADETRISISAHQVV